MNKVFGEKINNINYENEKRSLCSHFQYLKNKVMTVHNAKGHHFLPGDGIENGESHFDCIEREMLEETGYRAFIIC
ncbi:NUDIX domain-containing protein [Rossellomorea marisflavi]|uniref:NUDIX domain-containing protein n=1 Tax=Rossellomorea marisflavi TaxID=189381 RepID=UPI00069F6F23|nr:NUDIX domain-containing protein [Rossellomorea marisflavi]